MPRALIAPAAEQVAFQECESPPLAEGQVRVKSLYAAAKHGTEMSMFKGYASPRGHFDSELRIFDHQGEGVQYPVPLGNMGVGEVVELGPGVTQFKEGDRIFCLRTVPRRTRLARIRAPLARRCPLASRRLPRPSGFCPRRSARRTRPHRRRRSHLGPRSHQPDGRTILPLGRCPSHHRPRPIAQPARSSPCLRSRPRPRPHPMRRWRWR